MLICPLCQFENSEAQLACKACGQPFQRWRVIDLPNPGVMSLAEGTAAVGDYLDGAQRYRLLTQDRSPHRPLIVIDGQPDRGSPLQGLQQVWLELPTLDPARHPLAASVPPSAYPYLALQADYFPAVPEVHQAWTEEGRTLLLVEDRSTWPLLTEIWPTLDDPLQRLQLMLEMTLLWDALTPWHGQSTLLNPQHLTLNSSNLLCLTQLDQQPDSPALPLAALGQWWQQLLFKDSLALPEVVLDLVDAIAQGSLTDLAEVQAALAAVAQTLRNPMTPTTMNRSADGDLSLEDWDGPETDPHGPDAIDSDLAADADTVALPKAAASGEVKKLDEEDWSGLVETPTMVLPMKLAQLEDSGQTHVGQQRRHNEDWYFTQTQLHKVSGPQGTVLRSKGLYILCDGMGGHASGEVASQLAVRTLRDYFAHHWGDRLPDRNTLIAAVMMANQAIFDINQSKATAGVGRMGTTLVMVLIHNLEMAVVHVGDSRLYSYDRRLGLRQLTLDHEVGQREINRGVEPAIAYARPDAYQLTQALGPRGPEEMTPSVEYHTITEDTLLLLCSDGLSDNDLLERHVDSHMANLMSARAKLDSGVAQLIELANEKNGHDNITAILVRIKLQPDLSPAVP